MINILGKDIEDGKDVLLSEGKLADQPHLHALESLKELRNLSLLYWELNEVGFEIIVKLAQLRHLSLCNCVVLDQSILEQLAQLKLLSSLSLSCSNIDDRGLSHLAELIQLEGLNLQDTKISSHGMRHLANLSNITTLRLKENSGLDDECFRHLKSLPNLEEIHLGETSITLMGLKQLSGKSFPSLRLVILERDWPIDQMCELSKRIPNCEFLLKGYGIIRDGVVSQ